MKALLLLALVPVAPAVKTNVSVQKYVQFNVTPKATSPWKTCSSGSYCLTGFSLKEMVGTKQNTLATFSQATKSYNLAIPSTGTHTYVIYQNGRNAQNVSVQSANSPTVVVVCTQSRNTETCTVKGNSQAAK